MRRDVSLKHNNGRGTKMIDDNNADVFAKITEEAKTYLSGENLENALDLLVYLKDSGRTWILSEYHPEFFYMGELTCLIAYLKSPMDGETYEAMRRQIEEAGNRFVYDPSSSWNICCWQNADDIYEPIEFPVSEDLKQYARANVWRCIGCHTGDDGCPTPGGSRRTVFGREFQNACCNVFQLSNPDKNEMEHIKTLMELQKHIIAERKQQVNKT